MDENNKIGLLAKQNWLPCFFCLAISVLFLGAIFVEKEKSRSVELTMRRIAHDKVAHLLLSKKNFLGKEDAPYILFEFGDYECPPCHNAQPKIKELLKKYDGKLQVRFCHLPLSQIHPLALSAAEFAEQQRLKGGNHRFWQTHDKLYSQELNKQMIHVIGNADLKLAKASVSSDIKLAKYLEINSTPTFIICTPSGNAYKVPPDQFPDFVQNLIQ